MKFLRKLFMKLLGNPEEPSKRETFTEWFDRQGFKYFSAKEFTSYFNVDRYGVQNSPPPRELWVNILPTLHMVERLRYVYGVPITINSSYRSEDYNEACGGSKDSLHKQFKALDISAKEATPHELHHYLDVCRDLGEFKGGLSKYPTFVHIDTRGVNKTW